MLSAQQNAELAQVGRGTLMGELLRRYWLPIAPAAELLHTPLKPLRLLGEDLVLFRLPDGAVGLLDRHCPHRRADLAYGWCEADGLRCNYHGWKFAPDGACLAQPFEQTAHPDARFQDRVRAPAYPVRAHAGLLWAYLGPLPAPELPDWEPFSWRNGFKQIVVSEIPCNWFQCQENSIDPVHFEWLHDTWSLQLRGQDGPPPPTHLRLRFDEFPFGFQYKRIRAGQTEQNELWTIGRVCLWPNCLFTGEHFEWRVPIDDERTLSVGWFFNRVPEEMEPFEQTEIPYWYGPIRDERTGRWLESHVMNQDFVAWVGQGAISDRTQEHLGESDRGILLMRRRMLEEARQVQAGRDPKAVIRDPQQARRIPLPIVDHETYIAGFSFQDVREGRVSPIRFREEFIFQAGQPEEIRQAYRAAMGFDRFKAESEGKAALS